MNVKVTYIDGQIEWFFDIGSVSFGCTDSNFITLQESKQSILSKVQIWKLLKTEVRQIRYENSN